MNDRNNTGNSNTGNSNTIESILKRTNDSPDGKYQYELNEDVIRIAGFDVATIAKIIERISIEKETQTVCVPSQLQFQWSSIRTIS